MSKNNYRTVTGIAIYDLSGRKIKKVKNFTEAINYTNIQGPRIADCLYNRANYAGNYQFRNIYGSRVINKLPAILIKTI